MRKKLVELDLIDCVISIGKNLFFNSPMEACIIIARTKKEPIKKNKALFINAIQYVTRKNAESYLLPEHIETILRLYQDYKDVPGLSKVVTLDEIKNNDNSLSVKLFVPQTQELSSDSIEVLYTRWNYGTRELSKSINEFIKNITHD